MQELFALLWLHNAAVLHGVFKEPIIYKNNKIQNS